MSKKSLTIGTVIGFGLGWMTSHLLKNNDSKLTPEAALETANATFSAEGPTNGSWIYLNEEKYKKNDLNYYVYRGGITREINGDNITYDFIIDSTSGTVLHAEKVNS